MDWPNEARDQDMMSRGQIDESLGFMLHKNKLSHAYLFCGQGAREQALLLAMAVNCRQATDGEPCKICNCCQRIRDGNFADLVIIEPDNNHIRIEQLKKMQAQANLRSYEGGSKVFIIDEADKMKDEAANSLLKILEEPPEDTIFILCARQVQGILPTIISRCQYHSFGPAADFVLDEDLLTELKPQAEEFFLALPQISLANILIFSQQWHQERQTFVHFLSLILRLLHDNVKYANGPFLPAVALEAALFSERAINLLQKNINQRLLADVFFIRLWSWLQ